MIRRRATAVGLKTKIGNHTFRATGITAYLKNKGTLEAAQHIANHESPRNVFLFVNDAAGIAASGRWAAINVKIEALAASTGPDNAWWVQLFASLCSQNFGEYLSLKRAYESKQNDDAALLAWRARNLLELSVWSTYCAKNRDNARRVYEDAGSDVRGIYDAFIKWGTATAQAADWLDPLATAKQDLSERARLLDGITSIDGPYKQVSDDHDPSTAPAASARNL